MEALISDHPSTSVDHGVATELELESSNVDSLEVVSSKGDAVQQMNISQEVLTRIELDLAYSYEKLINLNVLVMHVATRESDYEAFFSEEKEPTSGDSALKALEFDFLTGLLDSEVNELDNFVSSLQSELLSARRFIASCELLEVCDESLKQSLEQLSELKAQSATFQRIICTSGKHVKESECFNNSSLSNLDTGIKMQTAEQQRHILRMLEKSLARELDLEKKLTESKQSGELLNLRLQEEIFFMEDEAEAVWERVFRAENYAEVLLSTSKELLGRLQIVQFSLNGSTQREEGLRSKLQDASGLLEAKDCSLRECDRTITGLLGEVKLLKEKESETSPEQQNVTESAREDQDFSMKIDEMENEINHLKQNNAEAENRAETAEAECKSLREANMELEKELNLIKSGGTGAPGRIEQLERQLQEADIQLAHAVACAEASLEKQAMLDSTIKDMENLIIKLKSKVSKAESQTDNAEEKCIILSESNADLHEELDFLRGRMKCLEASLDEAEEQKKAASKDISTRTKLITDLLVQLAFERERLHKQIYSLTKDKKVMQIYLQKYCQSNPCTSENHKDPTKDTSKHDNLSKGSADDVTNISATSSERCSASQNEAENESVRNIDAWQLNIKWFLFPVFVILISAAAAFWVAGQGNYVI